MISIYSLICQRLGTTSCPQPSDRSIRIFANYDRILARSRRQHDRLYIENLVNACLANLAGANGDREATQRTRIEL